MSAESVVTTNHRSCEKAIMNLLEYLNDGYEWIVDIDLEKFFRYGSSR